jgi:uncharacterized protein (UPF0261 family)
MPKTVALIAALDVQGPEAAFLRDRLRKNGLRALVIDAGLSDGSAFKPDVPRRAFHAEGRTLLAGLRAAKRIHGALALAGPSVGAETLAGLPFGVPKILVAGPGGSNARALAGAGDLCVVHGLADTLFPNRVAAGVLSAATDALAGLLSGPATPRASGRPLVALTALDRGSPAVAAARAVFELRGFAGIIFPADGLGGRAMERLAADGILAGVCDLATADLADELLGGLRAAGPGRLEAAATRGVPRVVGAGGLDAILVAAGTAAPDARTHPAGDGRTLRRTTVAECVRLGEVLARKANASTGRARVCLPLRGLSALDGEGRPLDDPAARRALFDSIQANLDLGKVELAELDLHADDASFGEAMAKGLLDLMEPPAQPATAKRAPHAARMQVARSRPTRTAKAGRR